jgi:hypothetical protein
MATAIPQEGTPTQAIGREQFVQRSAKEAIADGKQEPEKAALLCQV